MKNLLNFVALDIETTGFDNKEDEIIEIGAVRYKGDSEIERFSLFIKPHKPVPQFIKQLTNINDEQLADGESLNTALEKTLSFLSTDIVVCHNCSFDLGFLNAKLQANQLLQIPNRTLDTLELSRIYLPFVSNHKLSTVADYFNIDLTNAHRAIHDAKATGEILIELLSFIEKNIPLSINYRLLELTASLQSSPGLIDLLQQIVEIQKNSALLQKQKPNIDFHNRNYLEHQPDKAEDVDISTIFREGGLFDLEFDQYELREGQIQMAKAILEKFLAEEFLLVEAGTGVGKSLAYLIPALIYSNQHDQAKIVVSTNTKNLQEQLFYKDLPTVSRCIPLPFKAALLKGRRNYLCIKKWLEISMDSDRMLAFHEKNALPYLLVWKEFTTTGDISENSSFDSNRHTSLWKKISADSFDCQGRRCPHYKQCFLMDIRKKAENSNLVIINHHLLLADMQTGFSALGEYFFLIIDEAHNLPQLAQTELGTSISFPDFQNFCNSLFVATRKYQYGVLVNLKSAAIKSSFDKKEEFLARIENVIEILESNKKIFENFFLLIRNSVENKGSYGKLRIKNVEDHHFFAEYMSKIIGFWKDLSAAFRPLCDQLSKINSLVFVDHSQHLETMQNVQQRIAEYYDLAEVYFNPNLKENAFWMETFSGSDENYPSGFLCYCPLEVGEIFFLNLYQKMKSVVFTSATMAIRDKFKYFASRMGLDLMEEGFVQELVVQSPFDYLKQAMVVVAGFLPNPNDKFFQPQCLNLIKRSIDITKAGTMVLFTSYKNLNDAFERLSQDFFAKDIPLMAQGKGLSRSAMLQEFRKNKTSVLFGTNSFWEGVDVPGESLELLILQKLPFMVPSEPIVEAYLEKLAMEGKDSFNHFMLPNALLKYRQGFGRLIRHKTDHGIVVIFDNRIVTKNYGKYFIETVPAQTVITRNDMEFLDYISSWFSRRRLEEKLFSE